MSCGSLHIHTKTNPHKVFDITQRCFQKCSYQRTSVECTVREHPAFCSLSQRSPVWGECLAGGMGSEMSGAARGSLFCWVRGTGVFRDWTLSSGVNRRAGLRAHQECGRLISSKGAPHTLKEKQTSL